MKPFYRWSPLTYQLSVQKCRFRRRWQDKRDSIPFARYQSSKNLPILWYKHRSLIRRTLGEVDPLLQENKAVNLALSAPKSTG